MIQLFRDMKYDVSFSLELQDNPYPGTYIALEGIDGCGKTTQIKKVAAELTKSGKKVEIIREPSNTGVVGRLIREILQGKEKIPPVAFQYLFAADRTIQMENVIIPALKSGKIVISDRCFWSAVPYGMMDRGAFVKKDGDAQLLLVAYSILSMYHRFIRPDYTFCLEVSVPTAAKRLKKMDKIKEIYEKEEKLKRLATGYSWLVEKFPKEFTTIDGEGDVEEVTKEILKRIKN